MAVHNVTLIRGDGTGPELVEATRRVLEAAVATSGSSFNWDVVEAGVDIMETAGTPLPANVLESIRKNNVALKGPITTPIGTGFRSVNVALRKDWTSTPASARASPTKASAPATRTLTLVIVRETPRTFTAGVEYDLGTPEAQKIIEMAGGKIRSDSAISIKPFSITGVRRIIKMAFDYAIENKRKKITAVCKPTS